MHDLPAKSQWTGTRTITAAGNRTCIITLRLRYENFAVNQKASIFCLLYVIKEFAHAFSCAYIELWMHLGSLESTQEARVALGYRRKIQYTIGANF